MRQELKKIAENGRESQRAACCHHPIYGAFHDVSCFLMPEPDRKVRIRGKNGPALKAEGRFISVFTAWGCIGCDLAPIKVSDLSAITLEIRARG